jgi:hypothetical protein
MPEPISHAEMIERVARIISDKHFRRKQHYGACTQDERVAWLVETYWRNWTDDAAAVLAALPPSPETP